MEKQWYFENMNVVRTWSTKCIFFVACEELMNLCFRWTFLLNNTTFSTSGFRWRNKAS